MTLPGIVLQNLVFHRKKVLPVLLLGGVIMALPLISYLLVRQITVLADRPLASLKIELIMQADSGDKDASGVRTSGLMEPFNLHHFTRQHVREGLSGVKGIERYSTALVLWQFSPQNTLTVVGLNLSDDRVGLRRIEHLLMKGSRFFSGNRADEVILERHFATLFGYKPGGRFPLAGRELSIVGLVDFTEQSNLSNAAVFIPYDTALELANIRERVVNQVFLDLSSSNDTREVSRRLASAFPGFSLINRDSLYKNLSAFNRLIYQGGRLVVVLVLPIAMLLLYGLLKMHRLEFKEQDKILEVLGWSRSDIFRWKSLDLGFLLLGGGVTAGLISGLLYFLVLSQLRMAPLLNQGFQL